MIFDSERSIALTCPACQMMQEHTFSLFAISEQPMQLVCGCGFYHGHVRKSNKRFELDVLSVEGDRARIQLSRREFFESLLSLSSPRTGQNLGYLGSPMDIRDIIFHAHKKPVPHLDDFSNPEIMGEILDLLQDLAEQEKIRCECEYSSIGVDVYSERVELVCAFCGSVLQINANTDNDQKILTKVTEIVMEPCTWQMLGKWLKPLT